MSAWQTVPGLAVVWICIAGIGLVPYALNQGLNKAGLSVVGEKQVGRDSFDLMMERRDERLRAEKVRLERVRKEEIIRAAAAAVAAVQEEHEEQLEEHEHGHEEHHDHHAVEEKPHHS